MDGKRLVVLAGLVAVTVAVVLLFLPVRSEGRSCGSVANPPDLSFGESSGCDDARSSRQTQAIVAGAIGVVLLAGSTRVHREIER